MLPDVLGIHPSFFYFSGKRTILRFSAFLYLHRNLMLHYTQKGANLQTKRYNNYNSFLLI